MGGDDTYLSYGEATLTRKLFFFAQRGCINTEEGRYSLKDIFLITVAPFISRVTSYCCRGATQRTFVKHYTALSAYVTQVAVTAGATLA